MSNLDKFVLKFERIKGDLGGLKNKVVRKIKPRSKLKAKQHPFLKEQRLVKNWGAKLEKPIKKAKAKVNKPVKKVSRRRTQ